MNGAPHPGEIVGWLVVTSRGFRSLHLDVAAAVKYAADNHGLIYDVTVKEKQQVAKLLEANHEDQQD
jgi:hypothetical protein